MKPSDKFNELTAKLIATIENGETGEWLKPFKSGGLPKNYATQKPYRGANVLFLWMMAQEKGYKTNQWLTFNQVSAMGGHVLKGELATPVFFFKFMDVKEEDEMGEMTQKHIPLFKTYTVFNVDQTSLELSTDKVNHTIPEIETFIQGTKATIKPSQEAFFSPSSDYIGMPDLSMFESEEHYYSTLLHELSHWSGHTSRLNRDMSGTFGSESYAFEELIAELSSCFLNAELGIDYTQMRHEAYLQSWLNALKAKPNLLWKAASQAQKAYDYLKGFSEEREKDQAA